jgi:hypothetical protein
MGAGFLLICRVCYSATDALNSIAKLLDLRAQKRASATSASIMVLIIDAIKLI